MGAIELLLWRLQCQFRHAPSSFEFGWFITNVTICMLMLAFVQPIDANCAPGPLRHAQMKQTGSDTWTLHMKACVADFFSLVESALWSCLREVIVCTSCDPHDHPWSLRGQLPVCNSTNCSTTFSSQPVRIAPVKDCSFQFAMKGKK